MESADNIFAQSYIKSRENYDFIAEALVKYMM